MSCAAGIGLLGAPTGLDFSMALMGKVNTVTNAFTTTFSLDRFPGSDGGTGGRATGPDMNGTQPLPGATWFGFSNPAVQPITPPTLGTNEISAISFTIAVPFNPQQIEGLQVQYGSGVGTNAGLPDFLYMPDPAHSSQYSGVVNVPGFGTNNWSVPEPATWIYSISALTFVAGRSGARRLQRFSRISSLATAIYNPSV